jgi:hypothetical protein
MEMRIKMALTEWQVDYLESENMIKMTAGASDTGKSWICRFDLIRDCMKYAGSIHFATASTWEHTRRAVVNPILEELDRHNIRYLVTYKQQQGIIEFVNGSQIELLPAEKVYDRMRSREFFSGFVEELTTIPDQYMEQIFTEATRRLRQQPRPGWGIRKNENVYHLRGATNGDREVSWIYENVFEPTERASYEKEYYDKLVNIGVEPVLAEKIAQFHITEIPYSQGFNADDPEREAKTLIGSEWQRAVFHEGKWAKPDGVAFILEQGVHIKDVDSSELEKFYITFDYGFSPDPMVYLLCSEKNGIIFILDEYVWTKKPVHKHGVFLDVWYEQYNIAGFTGETATGAGEIRDLIRQQHISYYPTTKKRDIGWTTLANLVDQERLVIDRRCKELIKSLGSLVWIGTTGSKYHRRGVDVEGDYDDPADALRYFVMSSLIYNRITKSKSKRKAIIL